MVKAETAERTSLLQPGETTMLGAHVSPHVEEQLLVRLTQRGARGVAESQQGRIGGPDHEDSSVVLLQRIEELACCREPIRIAVDGLTLEG